MGTGRTDAMRFIQQTPNPQLFQRAQSANMNRALRSSAKALCGAKRH